MTLITIPDESPMSWNSLYSGKHWSVRWNEAKRVHKIVRAHLDPEQPVYHLPVNIHIRAYFASISQQLDADNIIGKIYVDGLKGWLIPDDTAGHVASVTTSSHIDRERPRVEIELVEATV